MSVQVSIGYSPEKGKPEQPVVIEVHKEWSPRGAERFMQMLEDGLYDGCKMHRVVPGFIVQFGIAANPAKQAKWQHTIKDDPSAGVSNTKGTISFAKRGPDTRSTQVFVNLIDNPDLDTQGFTPIGRVISGFDALAASYPHYTKTKPDPTTIKQLGNDYLDESFPNLGTFGKARVH
eukprot:TRINITY_DN13834_c0_g2_i1.p1 TRINITY_DN13834_c0_g2~~TRINITY_DN13834_c0_g2_i1.p1  ORF type:complete len:187 (+),score=40.32 TRINITY_DN13834_c0_g2_i1:35-562(+)